MGLPPLVGARPPEGKYDPLWRVKVMSGKNKTNFFRIEEETKADEEKEKVIVPCDSSVLTPWSTVTPITNIGGLWFCQQGLWNDLCHRFVSQTGREEAQGRLCRLGHARQDGPRR